MVQDFWEKNPSNSQVSKPNVIMTNDKFTLKRSQIKREIPLWMYGKLSPYMGKQSQKNAQKMMKTEERAVEIKKIFHFFTKN